MKLILKPTDPETLFAQQGGGKARNLAAMSRRGLPVPDWFCVGAECFDRFVAEHGLERELADTAGGEAVERRFLALELSEAVTRALREALGTLTYPVAVRSSGLDEDSAEHSFAGQFSSFLFQTSEAEVIESLKRGWASAFSERALAYRRSRGIRTTSIRMGVVVQKMVDAESAGVAFSRNPMKPLERGELVVSSVWGLGEGLVSGALEADHFTVCRDTLAIQPTIAEKPAAMRRSRGSGLVTLELPEELRLAPSLTDAQVAEISRLVLRLEKDLGSPQDCEWAYEGGKLYVLQTRPITSLPPDAFFDPRINGDQAILWDNSNIIESFAGVTTPLTFSHVSRAYRQVYLQFCEVMGVPAARVRAHEPTFRNMLGLIRGRIYYNLGSWYQLLFLFPFTASNQSFMETMMGVKQGLRPEVARLFDFARNPPRYSALRKAWLLTLTVIRIFRIRGIIARFNREIGEAYARAYRQDFALLSLPEQVGRYFEMEREMVFRWKAPIINDTRCMIFFGTLKRLTVKWLGAGAGASLQNDLLCGQGDLASTEPTRVLMRIAAWIETEPAFRARFLSLPPREFWRGLPAATDPASLEFRARFQDYLERFGFRCANELKLEESDLHDDPGFALDNIGSFLRLGNTDVAKMQARERVVKEKAEALVRERLRGWRRRVYLWVLKHARASVKDREDLRLMRTRTFGVTRRLFRAMGLQLARLQAIAEARDVFYLTAEEIIAFSEGRALTLDFRGLVALRKAEYETYRRTPAPPDRFITVGAAGLYIRDPALLAEADLLRDENARASDDPNVLLGTPCCPGVVEGVVRVVRELSDAEGLAGEILVTERTDPGWVPLFPSCSGLLIERGSLLSHSAVVARELAIPTIVGISGGLLKKLKTGDRVRMDAASGQVTLLEEETIDA